MAFEEFDLRPGDTVVDVGCGTGLSFPLIESSIGRSGRLIGVEPSSEMMRVAEQRVAAGDWKNITLIPASAQNAGTDQLADALVIFRVHEVLRSRPALENLLRLAKPGARLLVVGVKWAAWWAAPLNLIIWRQTRSVTTTHEGFHRPWDHLEDLVPNLTVRTVDLGAQFIARGTTPQ
jgi:demethylmenaquinone methyltransferase/2-methoxy-6-polyprenyl-1,4-benzoquinol methylase